MFMTGVFYAPFAVLRCILDDLLDWEISFAE